MIRRPPRSTPLYSSAASDVYKRQELHAAGEVDEQQLLTGELPLDGGHVVDRDGVVAVHAGGDHVGRVAARGDAPYVITTRMDSDDAIAVDYMAAVQGQFARQEL